MYVGGVNRIFHLSSELYILETAITGPIKSNESGILIDNLNQVLLINYTNSKGRLITCGTINEGSCQVRNLENISIIEEETQEAVVPEDACMCNCYGFNTKIIWMRPIVLWPAISIF